MDFALTTPSRFGMVFREGAAGAGQLIKKKAQQWTNGWLAGWRPINSKLEDRG